MDAETSNADPPESDADKAGAVEKDSSNINNEKSSSLMECGCCFDESDIEEMVQCGDGHLFCMGCLRRYADEAIHGQGKSQLICMTMNCGVLFPRSQLARALTEELMLKFDERVQEESLNMANLANLARCPDCNYAAEIEDENQKVFACPQCTKVSCRYCQVDWSDHEGLTCAQVEKKDETSIRTKYEELMTEARVRHCPQCKAPLLKDGGCNRVTCRCGNTICYICRKPDIKYDHFCQHVGPHKNGCRSCTKCSLWTDAEADDRQIIKQLKQQGKIERNQKGFLDNKVIGAPEPKQKAPHEFRARRQDLINMPQAYMANNMWHNRAPYNYPQIPGGHQPVLCAPLFQPIALPLRLNLPPDNAYPWAENHLGPPPVPQEHYGQGQAQEQAGLQQPNAQLSTWRKRRVQYQNNQELQVPSQPKSVKYQESVKEHQRLPAALKNPHQKHQHNRLSYDPQAASEPGPSGLQQRFADANRRSLPAKVMDEHNNVPLCNKSAKKAPAENHNHSDKLLAEHQNVRRAIMLEQQLKDRRRRKARTSSLQTSIPSSASSQHEDVSLPIPGAIAPLTHASSMHKSNQDLTNASNRSAYKSKTLAVKKVPSISPATKLASKLVAAVQETPSTSTCPLSAVAKEYPSTSTARKPSSASSRLPISDSSKTKIKKKLSKVKSSTPASAAIKGDLIPLTPLNSSHNSNCKSDLPCSSKSLAPVEIKSPETKDKNVTIDLTTDFVTPNARVQHSKALISNFQFSDSDDDIGDLLFNDINLQPPDLAAELDREEEALKIEEKDLLQHLQNSFDKKLDVLMEATNRKCIDISRYIADKQQLIQQKRKIL